MTSIAWYALAGIYHALAQAALLDKRFLQPPDVLVEQLVCLVNQADDGVGRLLRRAAFYTRRICLMRHILSLCQGAHLARPRVVLGPKWQSSVAQDTARELDRHGRTRTEGRYESVRVGR